MGSSVRRARGPVALLAAFGVLTACTGTPDPPPPPVASPVEQPATATGRNVVGYFVQWGAGRGYRVRNVQASGSAARLTHLVYAFGKVADGRCTVGDPAADHEQVHSAADSVDGVADTAGQPVRGNINQLRKLKQLNPRLKVLWSFGGWTGSGGFGQAARDPAGFAESCHRVVEDPRWADVFDGIDIDWEYPNACGLSCDTSGRTALAELASALRARFGGDSLVTAAVTGDANPGGRLEAADYARAAVSMDWLMVMTYDYAGTGSPRGPTAPHSPLTSAGAARAGSSTEAAIAKLVELGVPARKLLLGLGFYGRGWTGVTRDAPGGAATGPAPGTYEKGIEDYRVLARRCPPTGTVAGTAYARCGAQWWSYDTPSTIAAKMAFAKRQGLGGSFFWELSGDTTDGALVRAVSSGLA